MKKLSAGAAICLLFWLLLVGSLRADVIAINGATMLLTGPNVTTISFDETSPNPPLPVSPGTQLTTQYSSLGVTFGVNPMNASIGVFQSPLGNIGVPNEDANAITNFLPSQPNTNPVVITFNQPVTEAVIAVGTQPYQDGFPPAGTIPTVTTFTAYLNGTQVGQFTGSTGLSYNNDIFGFSTTNGSTFNSVTISTNSVDGAMAADNLQYIPAPVPEPSTLVLFGLGVLGMIALARRSG